LTWCRKPMMKFSGGRTIESKWLKDHGLSLVELLIVLAIIGIIASLTMPIYVENKEHAILGVTRANLKVIQNSLATYMANNADSRYPSGSFNYADFITLIPESNLPAHETQAKFKQGTFSYMSDGITYSITVASLNRTSAVFVLMPSGINRL